MDVYSLLSDIADCGNVTQQHVHSLYESFLANPQTFYQQLENCYLKIIKNFSGTSKQHRDLFETITDKLITFLVKKWNESTLPAQKTRKQISADNTRSFLLQLMQLFAEGVDSTQFATRICCGRHLFMVLRCIPPQLLNLLVDEKTAYDMLNHTVGLFKNSKFQKTGKTQKGLAVKLGSYLQHIVFEERKQGKLKQAIIALKYEMVRTICEDEKKELRLDALTNTEFNESTLPFILIRLRDVDIDVRIQVFKKLMKNKNSLTQLSTLDLYQVIFDGLKSNNLKVVDQCEIYLQQQFGNIIAQESAMQEEIKSRSARKSLNPELTNRLYEQIKRFLSLFQIEKTLIFPNLYSTIMDVFKCILKSVHQDELAYYFRDVLRKFSLLSGGELAFVKVLCKMSQDPEEKIHLPSQLNMIVDHNFPDGPDFAALFNRNLDILQFYELLQISELRINQEEIGRKLLLEEITQFIGTYKEMYCPRLTSQKYNEVYEDKTDSELQSEWFAQHHFEMPIIKSYYELLTPCIKIVQQLVTEQNEMVELVLQTIQKLQSQIIIDDVTQKELALQARVSERLQLEEEKDTLMKKKKQNLPSLQLNEQLLEQNEKVLQQIQKEYDQLLTHNRNIDVHCLYLLDALFNLVEIAQIEDKMFIKLKNQAASISERHKNGEDTLAKQLSFRCLGYIPLFGIDVGGSTVATLARILDQTIPQQDNLNNPMTITALRSLLDAMLMYNEDQSWVIDTETYGKAKILQIIVKFAFKSQGLVQGIALEGLAKLLLHDKVSKPQVWLAQFLFLWFDAKLRQQEQSLQILTSFLKLYITSNLQFLQTFEKSLEIYFSICCYLHYVKDHILNPQIFETQQWQEASMLSAALSGIKIISYKQAGPTPSPSLVEFKDQLEFLQIDAHFVGPQERFIMYLCKLVSDHNNIVLHKIITQVSKSSDFLEMYDLHDKEENSQKYRPRASFYQALILFLEQCIERLEKANQDVKFESIFLRVLREEVQLIGMSEGSALRDAIMSDFDIQREDANQLVKEMKKNNLIIQGQKQVDEKKFDGNKKLNVGESDSEDGVRKKRKQSSESEIPVKKGGNKRRR